MRNLIQGGTPGGFKDLLKWGYEKTSYQIDPIHNTGFFRVDNGYMTQHIYERILKDEELSIQCAYRSKDKKFKLGNMYVYVYYSDGSTDSILLPLEYNNINTLKSEWVTTSCKYKTDPEKSIEYITTRIVGGESIILDITEISIYYNGSNSTSSYDPQEFQDKCILYGLDKDKPILR